MVLITGACFILFSNACLMNDIERPEYGLELAINEGTF